MHHEFPQVAAVRVLHHEIGVNLVLEAVHVLDDVREQNVLQNADLAAAGVGSAHLFDHVPQLIGVVLHEPRFAESAYT